MALKGTRNILETDGTKTCPSAASRGVVLVDKTSGSGNAIGDHSGTADLVANPSGYSVAGLLLGDVVNVDQTRYHLNYHKDETIIGGRVNLLRKGMVVTDAIAAVTPSAGQTAYLTSNGTLTNAVSATGGLVATPKVGQFRSGKDENGFAAVDVALPVV